MSVQRQLKRRRRERLASRIEAGRLANALVDLAVVIGEDARAPLLRRDGGEELLAHAPCHVLRQRTTQHRNSIAVGERTGDCIHPAG